MGQVLTKRGIMKGKISLIFKIKTDLEEFFPLLRTENSPGPIIVKGEPDVLPC
jgi:hypothetical protein